MVESNPYSLESIDHAVSLARKGIVEMDDYIRAKVKEALIKDSLYDRVQDQMVAAVWAHSYLEKFGKNHTSETYQMFCKKHQGRFDLSIFNEVLEKRGITL